MPAQNPPRRVSLVDLIQEWTPETDASFSLQQFKFEKVSVT